MLNQNNLNGKMIGLRYKYGDKTIFDSFEKCISLVREYPIVYTFLPVEYKNKEMSLTFLEANKKYLDEYKNILKAEREEDKKNAKENIYVSRSKGRFSHLTNDAVIDDVIDFEEITKDVDFLVKAAEVDFNISYDFETLGLFALTKDNYDEKAFKQAIKKAPQLIIRAYNFWRDNIEDFPKVIESVRTKNELFNNLDKYELAFYKCLDFVGDDEKALAYLCRVLSKDFEYSFNYDHIEKVKKMFSLMPVGTQNSLANCFYFNIKYIKKDKIDTGIIQDAINICPIAGDILPDEVVLKYDLLQSEDDEQVMEKCKKCGKCQMQFVRFR